MSRKTRENLNLEGEKLANVDWVADESELKCIKKGLEMMKTTCNASFHELLHLIAVSEEKRKVQVPPETDTFHELAGRLSSREAHLV